MTASGGTNPNGTNPNGTSPNQRDLSPQDLNPSEWQAFCFLTGELPPAQAEAFERQLAEDEFACLALARVTELSLLLAAEKSTPRLAVASSETRSPSLAKPAAASTPLGTSRVRRPAALGTVLGLAACLTAAVFVLLSAPPAPTLEGTREDLASVNTSANPSEVPLDDLIVRWNLARVGGELREHESLPPYGADINADVESQQTDASENECAFCVPDWMMAAVSLDVDESGEPANDIWEN